MKEEWAPSFLFIPSPIVIFEKDGFERKCDLCGSRSHWHSVIGRIYICSERKLLLIRDENNVETWKCRTLLKSEIGQLGHGFHWICRYRKKCREIQWANIRNLT